MGYTGAVAGKMGRKCWQFDLGITMRMHCVVTQQLHSMLDVRQQIFMLVLS
jgi:hypothetical protein